jgi:type III restriction enzyme
MRLRYDANQDFQLEALSCVTDLFDGQPRVEAPDFQLTSQSDVLAVSNRLDLSEERLYANLLAVQDRSGLSRDPGLRYIEATVDIGGASREVRFLNYSVEMETGTGKTYLYLRTALELHRRYGMRKFVVVVPSVAVREGVLRTLEDTEVHLRSIFDNAVYRYYKYDSANLAQVRQFAQSNAVEFMVMTIDSFNKAANIMVRAMDQMQGQMPIHLVQATHPILILDEPQNLESEKSRVALALLNPLFALRYSATHRDPYNLVYRLTPYDAYRRGLVKRIQVASVVRTDDANRPLIRLDEIRTRGGTAEARVTVHRLTRRGTIREETVTVRPGDRLADKAGRSEYDAYQVDVIDPIGRQVGFAPANLQLREGESVGAHKEDIFRAQIEYTISKHIETQRRVRASGVKVLSLFFIDRVENYASKDGLIRRLFADAFNRLKADVEEWRESSPEDVQAAYFAEHRRRTGEVELLESATGDSREDEEAYDLIMRAKETLLSFPDPGDAPQQRRKKQVCFIFSHSALREGWDNPNVFLICTLNQAASTMRKRQEVGRGVRLARDQAGERVFDPVVNVLTVVANESYERYVRTLQSEIAEEYQAEIEVRYGKSIGNLSDEERQRIIEEYGEGILPPAPPPADKPKSRLRKERIASREFRELWDRIKHKTRYSVTIDTERLLTEAVPEINRRTIMAPHVTIAEAAVVAEASSFEAALIRRPRDVAVAGADTRPSNLIAVMAELMERTTPHTYLTRGTLLAVLRRTSHKEAMLVNPYEFARVAVAVLKEKLIAQLVEGIRYEKVGQWWEMQRILDEEVLELFSRYTVPANRAVYDTVPCDSKVEREFAEALEKRKDVRLYMKLPPWFEVPTPLGRYRPDWAVVLESPNGGEPLLYLVAETKGATDMGALRASESLKIRCGAAHFGSKQLGVAGALDGVDYKVVSAAAEL